MLGLPFLEKHNKMRRAEDCTPTAVDQPTNSLAKIPTPDSDIITITFPALVSSLPLLMSWDVHDLIHISNNSSNNTQCVQQYRINVVQDWREQTLYICPWVQVVAFTKIQVLLTTAKTVVSQQYHTCFISRALKFYPLPWVSYGHLPKACRKSAWEFLTLLTSGSLYA